MEGTVLAASCLNLWSMDFKNNERLIIESIVQAKRLHNAKIRLGSACEVTGFSGEDHFAEPDTLLHSWQVLGSILEVTKTPPYNEILCVIGMPVCFRGSIYNSALVLLDGEILAIKPKTVLCNDLLTREKRWFTAWRAGHETFDYDLPENIRELYGQKTAKIGNFLLKSADGFLIGFETLDEVKVSVSSSTYLYLMGAHIVCCLGGNTFSLSENDNLDPVKTITDKSGGIYMYSNQVGFDGTRSYFEGSSLIISNGSIISSTESFSLNPVDLAVATVDLTEVDAYRGCIPSRNLQSAQTKSYEILDVSKLNLKSSNIQKFSQPVPAPKYSREDLVGLVVSSYLWDYLRKSGAAGFFLGMQEIGIENCCVLKIVSQMCKRALSAYEKAVGFNRKTLEQDVVRLAGKVPANYSELLREVMYSGAFLNNESCDEDLARRVAEAIGVRFIGGSVESIVQSYIEAFSEGTGLYFSENSNENQEALKSLRSRISMVLSYISGQLLTLAYNKKGFLIVLSSTCLETNLTGNHVKYGLSSGDLNPVGCIFHSDLKSYLIKEASQLSSIQEVIKNNNELAIEGPAASLNTEEIEFLAKLRKTEKFGPFSCFLAFLRRWEGSPEEASQKVRLFFTSYSKNRHKATVLTPLLQFDAAGVDDNRYDLRQFLYNISWTSQFQEIDAYLADYD